MKHIITFILLLLTIHLFAQEKYPRVEKIVVQDRLINGQIDKYPITIYLKYNQVSNYHAGVYSVEGWYHYDKVKTKIPLTGLYNYQRLTLYNFSDTTKSNELLNFREMKSSHWKDMEYYENLEDFKEKFVLSDKESSWMSGSKTLNVKLDQDDLSIQNVNEYLLLDSTTAFDLHNFGDWTWNFQLEAHKSGKYILKYEHMSRLYVAGMCGAGLEEGFLLLEFDENNSLVYSEEFIYESCNGSISTENQKENNRITTYNCYDYSNKKEYDLTVDLNELKIEKKEKN
ncbi:MAG: hypothetical protein ACK5MD_08380 [Flavobacteriales bacterium]